MVGGSASVASATDWHGHGQTNVCGNDVELGLVTADRYSEAEIEDSEVKAQSEQVICQNGEDNFAVNYAEYEGDFIDGPVDIAIPLDAVTGAP
jgi:hypothetical protein